MKGIPSFGDLRIIAFKFMTFETGRGLGFTFFKIMVAISAGKTVTRISRMGFVVKQNFPGHAIKHYSDRLLRRFGRKSGIAYNTHYK